MFFLSCHEQKTRSYIFCLPSLCGRKEKDTSIVRPTYKVSSGGKGHFLQLFWFRKKITNTFIKPCGIIHNLYKCFPFLQCTNCKYFKYLSPSARRIGILVSS